MSFLKLKEVTLQFGGVTAVDNISFEVEEGEVFSLVGPNGAGKSTIFNILSRFYKPNNGEIIFDGKNLLEKQSHEVASLGIARTFQNIELFEQATVLQNLLVARQTHRRSNPLSEMLFLPFVKKEEYRHRLKVEKVIDFLDLQAYRQKFISGLPYGVRKVVELGRALSIEPKLLLLDEPASGLSVEETQDVAFWIEDIKKVITHLKSKNVILTQNKNVEKFFNNTVHYVTAAGVTGTIVYQLNTEGSDEAKVTGVGNIDVITDQ